MSGSRSRGGDRALLVAASLYAVLMALLLRLPCAGPGTGEGLPALCTPEAVPAPAAGGFLTGGASGDQPALIGMVSTVVGWLAAGLSGPAGAQGAFVVLSVALLVVVWVATVFVVAALSGGRRSDAFVVALAPVVVLVGFRAWDLWAVLLLMLALFFSVRGSPVPAGVCLGLGASVALFPLVVLLAVLFLAVRYRELRDFLGVLVAAVLTWLLVNGAYLVLAGERWARQLTTPLDGPVGASSLWGLWGSRGEGAVPGGPVGPYVLLWLLLAFVAVLVLTLLTRHEPSVVQIAFLLLAVLVLLGTVYPVVHALWLVPLVVLTRRNWVEFAIWQLVEVLHWVLLLLPEGADAALPGSGLLGWDAQEVLAAARLLILAWLVVAVAVDVLRGRRAMQIGVSEPH